MSLVCLMTRCFIIISIRLLLLFFFLLLLLIIIIIVIIIIIIIITVIIIIDVINIIIRLNNTLGVGSSTWMFIIGLFLRCFCLVFITRFLFPPPFSRRLVLELLLTAF